MEIDYFDKINALFDELIKESSTLYKIMLILVGPHYVPWTVSDGRAKIRHDREIKYERNYQRNGAGCPSGKH